MKIFNLKNIASYKKSIDKEKRNLDTLANEARKMSKVAIFAMQRGDEEKSRMDMKIAKNRIDSCFRLIKKYPQLSGESSYKSALEEYAEAVFFNGYLNENVELTKEIAKDSDAVIGGLADLSGEIARYSVLKATEGDAQAIEKAHKTVLQIVDWLARMDLTGSLRSKFDQTKQHLRRIEDIRYDLSKRN